MANVKVEVKEIVFRFEPERTVVGVRYESDEPGNPFWGGGWKEQRFPASRNAVSIIETEIASLDYLTW